MFEQVKKGLKLVKYGLTFKMQIAFSVIFLLFGVFVEFAGRGRNMLGGFYIVLSAMFVIQLIISMDISTMVQTSPYKKKLQTSIPILTCTPIMLFSYTVVVLIRLYYIYLDPAISENPENQGAVKAGLMAIILLLFFVSAYMGICFKYFLVSLIGLVLFVYPISFIFHELSIYKIVNEIPTAAIVAAGYVLIIAGQCISYLLTRLTYKKDLSKYAFGAAMKRQNH